MKILDVDYFVKGHYVAEIYAAAHAVCKTIILDNQNEEFSDPDAANSRIFVEFAVYVSEVVEQFDDERQIAIAEALLQNFNFCVSKVDPEIKGDFDDRRQIKETKQRKPKPK